MPPCHRNTDLRYCTAQTTVLGQTTVFVNNLLWAVYWDPSDHLQGNLIPFYPPRNVFVNKLNVICAPGDHAICDLLFHCPTFTWPMTGSPNTFVYAGAGGA